MQLLLAVVQVEDAGPALAALTGAGLRATRIDTVGGFLRRGNVTLVIGVERERVPEVLRVPRDHCRTRTGLFLPALAEELGGLAPVEPIEVQVGGATIIVLDVERYERLRGPGGARRVAAARPYRPSASGLCPTHSGCDKAR